MVRIVAALLLVLPLTACGDGTSTTTPAPVASAVPSVEVAPSTVVSKITYHCPAMDIVVTWMSDRSSAELMVAKGANRLHLSSALPGRPLVGQGYILRGGEGDASVGLVTPDAAQSVVCKR